MFVSERTAMVILGCRRCIMQDIRTHTGRAIAGEIIKMRALRIFAFLAVTLTIPSVAAHAQLSQCTDQGTWISLTFPGTSSAIDTPLLLTDGRIMVQYV